MCARVCSSEQSVFVTQGRRLIHIEQGRVRLSASLVVEGGGGRCVFFVLSVPGVREDVMSYTGRH